MRELTRKILALAAAMTAAIAVAPASLAGEHVLVTSLGADPEAISAGEGTGAVGETHFVLRLEVREIGGLAAVPRRAPKADTRDWRVRWSVALRDADGNVAAEPAFDSPYVDGEPYVGVWAGRDATGAPVPDGTYRLDARVRVVRLDTLGTGEIQEFTIGETTFSRGTLVIDSTPPSLAIDVPECTAEDVVPAVVADDAHLAELSVTVDGMPWSAGTPVSAEGEHVVVADAVDLAGNRSTASASFVIDRTAPAVEISGVADGGTYPAGVSVTATFSDAHLVSTSLTLDGAAYVSGTAIDTPGEHRLDAVAEDCAGNRGAATVRFVIDSTSGGGTAVFVNPDDPALLRASGFAGSVLEAYGEHGPDGLPVAIGAIRSEDASGEVLVRLDADGRPSRLSGLDGSRIEIGWAADGLIDVDLVVGGGALRSARAFDPAAPAPAVVREPGRRIPGRSARLPELGRSRIEPALATETAVPRVVPPTLGPAITAATPEPATLPATAACEGTVTLSACGFPLDGADVTIRVETSDPAIGSWVAPADPLGGGAYGYRLPCAAAALPTAAASCSAYRDLSAGACAGLDGLDPGTVCPALVDALAYLSPAPSLAERDAALETCLALFARGASACEAARSACGDPSAVDLVDRRVVGDVRIDVDVLDDAVGAVGRSAGVSGLGPFPAFDVREDGEVRIVDLTTDRTAPATYNLLGRVACAPAETSILWSANMCNAGDLASCFPFDIPAIVEGQADLGFELSRDMGFDVVGVTFLVDGGPVRQAAVGF